MSSIMKVFLLLAAVVCISTAQLNESKQQCLCQRVGGLRPGMKSNTKEIQIYSATAFCNRVEIVVTTNRGLRYCLNPKLNQVQKLLSNMMGKQKTTTAKPTQVTSGSGSTDPARN